MALNGLGLGAAVSGLVYVHRDPHERKQSDVTDGQRY
jgi:hypothetical protein